jgi:hypothetical protein
MDPISSILITIGSMLLIASWIQLLISSSKEDFTWGLCTFFVPPLSYCYGLLRLDIAKDAWGLAALGLFFLILGIA